jgi:hypothetical protein
MAAEQVAAPNGASREVREAARRVNAVARKIDTRMGAIATSSDRVSALSVADNGRWLGPNKWDANQMRSQSRKARTAQIGLSQLQWAHAVAMLAYRTKLAQWEQEQRAIAAMAAHKPPTLEQMQVWARRVAAGEMDIVETIDNAAVAKYDWSSNELAFVKAFMSTHTACVALSATGKAPILLTHEDWAQFDPILTAATASHAAESDVINAPTAAAMWAPPAAERRVG